jgi:hypothetical protein
VALLGVAEKRYAKPGVEIVGQKLVKEYIYLKARLIREVLQNTGQQIVM